MADQDHIVTRFGLGGLALLDQGTDMVSKLNEVFLAHG